MDEPTIPQTATFQLKLPSFEGPLDLLLHLIKKHELNVLDLPIAFVTERYLEYLSLMEELDLDVASEYLLMAATLAHIKSKMLLPQTPASEAFEEQDEGYQEDPRAELIRRLLEYQKYKHAAENLGGRPMAGRDVFPRGMPAPEAQGPAELAPIDMYKLLDAFQAILKRVQGRVALEVTAERITIHERMTQLSDFLRARRTCTFDELFEGARTRYEVVVTFLALLEMTKLRMTRVYQADPKSALHVAYALLDENGELAEDVARAFEGVSADSVAPPMAAEEFAAAALQQTAAADGHEEAAAEDGSEDAAAADDAWMGEVAAADGGEEPNPWVSDEADVADAGEAPPVAHDAWLPEQAVADGDDDDQDYAAEETFRAADGAAGEPVEVAVAHDTWARAQLPAADGGGAVADEADVAAAGAAGAPVAAHDAWVREEHAAADGGEDLAPTEVVSELDARTRRETDAEADRDNADEAAQNESEPVSPNTDEWKP